MRETTTTNAAHRDDSSTNSDTIKVLAYLDRQFMTPHIWRADVWEVTANHGETHYVDAGVAGSGTTKYVHVPLPAGAVIQKQRQGTEFYETVSGVYRIVEPIAVPPDNLADYIEGTIDTDEDGASIATLHRDVYLAQLSANGYMDQTEVSMYQTRAEAEDDLAETYGDEVPEDEDDDEDEDGAEEVQS